ncbi:MAG: helix-turn-helix domain-containing protein [Planctomycetota bacterium]
MIDQDILRKTMAANVVRLRRERGLSQEELAGRCGISRVYLARIETAKNTIGADVLYTLADVLGVPADTLRQVSEAAVSKSA